MQIERPIRYYRELKPLRINTLSKGPVQLKQKLHITDCQADIFCLQYDPEGKFLAACTLKADSLTSFSMRGRFNKSFQYLFREALKLDAEPLAPRWRAPPYHSPQVEVPPIVRSSWEKPLSYSLNLQRWAHLALAFDNQ